MVYMLTDSPMPTGPNIEQLHSLPLGAMNSESVVKPQAQDAFEATQPGTERSS